MSPEELVQQKNVEFYAAGVNAWYNTSLEHDKSIFSLSAGGIGLLITLITTIGLSSAWLKFLYIAAIVCFLSSLISVLVIFRRNRKHIENVFVNTQPAEDALLKALDLTAIVAFGTGAAFASAIGVSVAFMPTKEADMSSDQKKQSSQPSPALESFNGIKNLQPRQDFTKSFNGIGNLQPQPTASAPVTQSAPAPAPVAPSPASSGTAPNLK
ncbi:hypothetical protein LJR039_004052 [Pseudorhodoferax sp. LjRoot39]|uniref:hypothetical protein n=1 Tax=Pseudorhodoferax sp. LjRoot39 TaxID=3342328 RepID=UPI003ECFAC08